MWPSPFPGALLLVVAVGAACTHDDGGALTRAPAPSAVARYDRTTMSTKFFSLTDLALSDTLPSRGQFVRGNVVDDVFVADGDVEGTAIVSDDGGHPGVVELPTMSFVGAEEAREPRRPHVRGRMTNAGFVATGGIVR